MKHAVSKPLYSLSSFIWQFLFILWVAHWFLRWPNNLPVPGYAVAILGLAAVIMGVRANAFTRIEEGPDYSGCGSAVCRNQRFADR